MAQYKVAVIGGDGIGPEVCEEALKVVRAAGIDLATTDYKLGAAHYIETGEILPTGLVDELRTYDAVLLGAIGPAIGSNEVPPGILERGLLLALRFQLDLYINMRPFNGMPRSIAPTSDFIIIRENTEGSYVGEGGFLRYGTPHEVATQGSVNTRHGIERCVRFAFELAQSRPRKHLTMVHKTNVLTFSGDLWMRAFNEVSSEFPDVETAYNHADAACIYLATDANRYDVVVTDNLFGDILTDLAGAVVGGIGFAASANLNPTRSGPSLFEPVHGAAHDIAGTQKANPLAAIRSAAMMLEHLGEYEAGNRVTKAVLEVGMQIMEGHSTMTTKAIGDGVVKRLQLVGV
jgi:3-isopropylmalate dehydrogenase